MRQGLITSYRFGGSQTLFLRTRSQTKSTIIMEIHTIKGQCQGQGQSFLNLGAGMSPKKNRVIFTHKNRWVGPQPGQGLVTGFVIFTNQPRCIQLFHSELRDGGGVGYGIGGCMLGCRGSNMLNRMTSKASINLVTIHGSLLL